MGDVVSRVRIPAQATAHVITDPVEGGWCESCALPSTAAVVVEVEDATCRHLLLCIVCRECKRGRSLPWL